MRRYELRRREFPTWRSNHTNESQAEMIAKYGLANDWVLFEDNEPVMWGRENVKEWYFNLPESREWYEFLEDYVLVVEGEGGNWMEELERTVGVDELELFCEYQSYKNKDE